MIKAFMQWFWRQLQRSSTQALTLPLSCAEPFWTKAQTIGGRWVSTPPITLKPKPPRGCLSSSTYLSWAITLLPALHAANTFLATAARHSISSITRWGCLGEFRILPEDLRMFTIVSRIGLIVTLFLMLGADHLTLDGGVGDLKKISCKRLSEEKNCMQHKCNRKLMEKKGKKYPTHQIARKKFLMTRNHPPPPSRVKWSAPYLSAFAIFFS